MTKKIIRRFDWKSQSCVFDIKSDQTSNELFVHQVEGLNHVIKSHFSSFRLVRIKIVCASPVAISFSITKSASEANQIMYFIRVRSHYVNEAVVEKVPPIHPYT